MDENQLQDHYLDTFNNDLMQQLVPFETYKDMVNDGGVSYADIKGQSVISQKLNSFIKKYGLEDSVKSQAALDNITNAMNANKDISSSHQTLSTKILQKKSKALDSVMKGVEEKAENGGALDKLINNKCERAKRTLKNNVRYDLANNKSYDIFKSNSKEDIVSSNAPHKVASKSVDKKEMQKAFKEVMAKGATKAVQTVTKSVNLAKEAGGMER